MHSETTTNDDFAIFDWPCTAFSLQVASDSGSGSITAGLNGGGSKFIVWGCDGSEKVIYTSKVLREHTLCQNAMAGDLIKVRKASEADIDDNERAQFYGIKLAEGMKLSQQEKPARKIEFFGDSDIAGYGILGPADNAKKCSKHEIEYEDCNQCYDSLLGKMLDAEIHVEAYSGLGVWQNAWDGDPTMPYYWNHTLATEDSPETAWDFKRWTPDLVIVYLGANDYNNGRPVD